MAELPATVPLFRAFVATLRRDLLLAFRRRSDFYNPLAFFLIVMLLKLINNRLVLN